MDFQVNYLAVLVAGVAAFAVGFLWHGPLFGNQWMRLSGFTDEQIRQMKASPPKGMWKNMLAALIQQLVMAFVLAHFVFGMGVVDAVGALQLAFWVWLGFMAMPMLDSVLWENRKMNLYTFNIAYRLVSLAVMALILALWR